MQDDLKVTVEMFSRVGFETNLKNKNSLVFNTRYIKGKWIEEAHKRRMTGEGGIFQGEKAFEGRNS